MGMLVRKMDFEKEDTMGPVEGTVTPFAKGCGTSTKKQKMLNSSNWPPYDTALESIKGLSETGRITLDEKVRMQEQRDKQKQEDTQKRLELDTKRHESDEKFRMEQLEVQKRAIEMQLEMQKGNTQMILDLQKGQADMMRMFIENMNNKN